MPLYTYIMSHKESMKVFQDRRSNYTGFLLEPISAMFPELKPAYGDLMRMKPVAVSGAARTWGCSVDVYGSVFTLHVIETRE